jgi:hypothetical protein
LPTDLKKLLSENLYLARYVDASAVGEVEQLIDLDPDPYDAALEF